MSTSVGHQYSYCCKNHENLGGNHDGCQEFIENPTKPLTCLVCGCHQGFHMKKPNYAGMVLQYEKKVVYTKCRRIYDPSVPDSVVDGCQLFADGGIEGSVLCECCGCHKNFHREEINVPLRANS